MSTNLTPYLTPAGRREAWLRLSVILATLEKSARTPEKDFQLQERKFAAELMKLWRETYGSAIKAVFKAVPDFAAEKAAAILDRIMRDKLGAAFGSSKRMVALVKGYITKSYSKAKSQWLMSKITKDSPLLSLPDKRAIDVLTRHNCFWIGQHYGNHVGPKIAKIAQRALDEGMGRDALAEELRQELGGVAPEGYAYWDVVSSAALVRARSFGSISGMEEAGITEYEILAMDDERMCDICGTLNGTVFSVAETRKVIDRALDIEDPEAFKAALPWFKEPPEVTEATRDLKPIDRKVTLAEVKRLTANGQSLPPFHGRCRCTLVMVSESETEVPVTTPDASEDYKAARAIEARIGTLQQERDAISSNIPGLKRLSGDSDARDFEHYWMKEKNKFEKAGLPQRVAEVQEFLDGGKRYFEIQKEIEKARAEFIKHAPLGLSPLDETKKWSMIKGEHGIKECASSTNPKFAEGTDLWTMNCQRCVPTYEMRRRGFDVVAKPRIVSEEDKTAKAWDKIFKDAQWERCMSGSGKREIESLMKEWGDGARAEVYVAWKSGEAHVFVAENVGGKIQYICPQSGKTDCSDYFKRAKAKCTEICRLDTLEPSQLITECCEPVAKEVNL